MLFYGRRIKLKERTTYLVYVLFGVLVLQGPPRREVCRGLLYAAGIQNSFGSFS